MTPSTLPLPCVPSVPESGNVSAQAGIAQTDIAQAEIASLRRELRERDDLLATAAHELRNPLHALTLQLQLARTLAEAQNQAETALRIAKAQKTLARYTDRVTVLMDLARLHSTAYPLTVTDVDLSAVVRAAAEGLTHEAHYRGVTLGVETPPACPAQADPLVVEQMLDNLMLNAFKHAACTRVTVTLRIPRIGWAEISVADDGRGIEPADQSRIFGKFDVATHSGRGEGTGLGLWIVRKLVAAVGGSISLDSRCGSGSVFTLEFPIAERSRQAT